MDNRFNTAGLSLKPLSQRKSKLSVNDLVLPKFSHPSMAGRDAERAARYLANAICQAKETDRKTVLFMGAHLIKLGLTRYITDLILNGYIDHVATNGACAIHDFELNTHGATSEDVQKYIDDGQFGLWKETSNLNDVVTDASWSGGLRTAGAGSAIGAHLYHNEGASPETSIFAACHKMNVPITVHILIGGDINHSHPNFDAAAWGICSYNDFLIFAAILRCRGSTGRLSPFKACTDSSLFTATTSTSPSLFAACSKYTWPGCKRSKQPLVNTTQLPAF